MPWMLIFKMGVVFIRNPEGEQITLERDFESPK
jgi:hypothetical protein